MKIVLITAMIVIIGFAGFLVYDWHIKTTIQQNDQRVTLYSWTDEKGEKHFTDTQPPDNDRNVEELKGFQYVEPPLAIRIKDKAVGMYRWVKEKVFKKKDSKKNKQSSNDGQQETIHATWHAHLQFISPWRCRISSWICDARWTTCNRPCASNARRCSEASAGAGRYWVSAGRIGTFET